MRIEDWKSYLLINVQRDIRPEQRKTFISVTIRAIGAENVTNRPVQWRTIEEVCLPTYSVPRTIPDTRHETD
jgi:hypothetical protein